MDDNNNNNNNNNNNLKNYLKHPNLKNYKKIFKSIKKLNTSSKFNNNDIYNNNNYFLMNDKDIFYCKVCKNTFPNSITHILTMMDKCPSIDKSTNSKKYIYIKTTLVTEYKTTTTIVKEKDLSTTTTYYYDDDDDSATRMYFITNYLLIKCPICLSMKENCVIQKCGHCICVDCLCGVLMSSSSNEKSFNCWICRQYSQQYLFT